MRLQANSLAVLHLNAAPYPLDIEAFHITRKFENIGSSFSCKQFFIKLYDLNEKKILSLFNGIHFILNFLFVLIPCWVNKSYP